MNDGAGGGCAAPRELVVGAADPSFDGLCVRWLEERRPTARDDSTDPTGVYGASKLAGEQAVLAAHANSALLRTAWVYSPFGSNFVKTMLRLADDRDEVSVVADQRGNPTSALDIADGIFAVAANLIAGDRANSARRVPHDRRRRRELGRVRARRFSPLLPSRVAPSARVNPITTAEYPTPARRPANSRLDCDKLALAHGVRLPQWQAS